MRLFDTKDLCVFVEPDKATMRTVEHYPGGSKPVHTDWRVDKTAGTDGILRFNWDYSPRAKTVAAIESLCPSIGTPHYVSLPVEAVPIGACTTITTDDQLRKACAALLDDLEKAVFSGYGLGPAMETTTTSVVVDPTPLPLVVVPADTMFDADEGIATIKLASQAVLSLHNGRPGVARAAALGLLQLPLFSAAGAGTSATTAAATTATKALLTTYARGSGGGDWYLVSRLRKDLMPVSNNVSGDSRASTHEDPYLSEGKGGGGDGGSGGAAPGLASPQERQMLGKGADGCVVRPPLACTDGIDGTDGTSGTVAKLVATKRQALNELMAAAIVRDEDPTGAATCVPLPVLCRVDPSEAGPLCQSWSRNEHQYEWQVTMPFAGDRTLEEMPTHVKASAPFLEAMWRVVPVLGRLAYAGLEHKDLHQGNIMVETRVLGAGAGAGAGAAGFGIGTGIGTTTMVQYVVRIIDFTRSWDPENRHGCGGMASRTLATWLGLMRIACVLNSSWNRDGPHGFAPGFLWRLQQVEEYLERDVGGRRPTPADVVVARAEPIWTWLAHGRAMSPPLDRLVHVGGGEYDIAAFPTVRSRFPSGDGPLRAFFDATKDAAHATTMLTMTDGPRYPQPSPEELAAFEAAYEAFLAAAVAADGRAPYDRDYCRALARQTPSKSKSKPRTDWAANLMWLPVLTLCASAECRANPTDLVNALMPLISAPTWVRVMRAHRSLFTDPAHQPLYRNGMIPVVAAYMTDVGMTAT